MLEKDNSKVLVQHSR